MTKVEFETGLDLLAKDENFRDLLDDAASQGYGFDNVFHVVFLKNPSRRVDDQKLLSEAEALKITNTDDAKRRMELGEFLLNVINYKETDNLPPNILKSLDNLLNGGAAGGGIDGRGVAVAIFAAASVRKERLLERDAQRAVSNADMYTTGHRKELMNRLRDDSLMWMFPELRNLSRRERAEFLSLNTRSRNKIFGHTISYGLASALQEDQQVPGLLRSSRYYSPAVAERSKTLLEEQPHKVLGELMKMMDDNSDPDAKDAPRYYAATPKAWNLDALRAFEVDLVLEQAMERYENGNSVLYAKTKPSSVVNLDNVKKSGLMMVQYGAGLTLQDDVPLELRPILQNHAVIETDENGRSVYKFNENVELMFFPSKLFNVGDTISLEEVPTNFHHLVKGNRVKKNGIMSHVQITEECVVPVRQIQLNSELLMNDFTKDEWHKLILSDILIGEEVSSPLNAFEVWGRQRGDVGEIVKKNGKRIFIANQRVVIEEKRFQAGDRVWIRDLPHLLGEKIRNNLNIEVAGRERFFANERIVLPNNKVLYRKNDLVYLDELPQNLQIDFKAKIDSGEIVVDQIEEEYFEIPNFTNQEELDDFLDRVSVRERVIEEGESFAIEDLPRFYIEKITAGMIKARPQLTVDPTQRNPQYVRSKPWAGSVLEEIFSNDGEYYATSRFGTTWKNHLRENGVDIGRIIRFKPHSNLPLASGAAIEDLNDPAIAELALNEKIDEMIYSQYGAVFPITGAGFDLARFAEEYKADPFSKGKIIAYWTLKGKALEGYTQRYSLKHRMALNTMVSIHGGFLDRSWTYHDVFSALEGKTHNITDRIYLHKNNPLDKNGEPIQVNLGTIKFEGFGFDSKEERVLVERQTQLNEKARMGLKSNRQAKDVLDKRYRNIQTDVNLSDELKAKAVSELLREVYRDYGLLSSYELGEYEKISRQLARINDEKTKIKNIFINLHTQRQPRRYSFRQMQFANKVVQVARYRIEHNDEDPKQVLIDAETYARSLMDGSELELRDDPTVYSQLITLNNRQSIWANLIYASKKTKRELFPLNTGHYVESWRGHKDKSLRNLPPEMKKGYLGTCLEAEIFGPEQLNLALDPNSVRKSVRYDTLTIGNRSNSNNFIDKLTQSLNLQKLKSLGEGVSLVTEQMIVSKRRELIADLTAPARKMKPESAPKFIEENENALVAWIRGHADADDGEYAEMGKEGLKIMFELIYSGTEYAYVLNLNSARVGAYRQPEILALEPDNDKLSLKRREVEEGLVGIVKGVLGMNVQVAADTDKLPITGGGRKLIYELDGDIKKVLDKNKVNQYVYDTSTETEKPMVYDYVSYIIDHFESLLGPAAQALLDSGIWDSDYYHWFVGEVDKVLKGESSFFGEIGFLKGKEGIV